jgi:hypothetical protein
MEMEEQKDRLARWSIAVASLVCIAVGAAFLVGLLSGHHTAGALLIAAGVVGLLGLLSLRRSPSRSRS